MKVNDLNLTGVSPDAIGGAGLDRARQTESIQRGRPNEANPYAGEFGDSVSLSKLSGEIRASGIESPERAARLEKLSSDVQSRRYQVDAGELSRRLIADAMKPLS